MSAEPANRKGRRMGNQTIDTLSFEETAQIIHDLHIHQAELEAKNKDILKTEAEVLRLKRDYADLFDITPIGLFLFGEKGLIEKVNRFGASMLTAENPNVIEGKPFIAFINSESAASFLDHLRQAQLSKKRQILRLQIKKLSGETFLAECDTTPVYDENGKFQYFRTVITDITDRSQTAQAMIDKHPK